MVNRKLSYRSCCLVCMYVAMLNYLLIVLIQCITYRRCLWVQRYSYCAIYVVIYVILHFVPFMLIDSMLYFLNMSFVFCDVHHLLCMTWRFNFDYSHENTRHVVNKRLLRRIEISSQHSLENENLHNLSFNTGIVWFKHSFSLFVNFHNNMFGCCNSCKTILHCICSFGNRQKWLIVNE